MAQANGHAQSSGAWRGLASLANSIADRLNFSSQLGYGHGGARNYYTVFGWDDRLNYQKYLSRYRRQDIARRIVNLPAEGTWQQAPLVSDDVDPEQDTQFEAAWNALAERIGLYDAFERADKLAGIGRYSLILIGAPGELASPLPKMRGPEDIFYTTSLSEGVVSAIELDGDRHSTRFGLPAWYEVDLGDRSAVDSGGGLAGTMFRWARSGRAPSNERVHWTRVIHVAENLLEDRVLGMPRLENCYNLLDDLIKVVGGSAEGFFRIARPIYHADINRDYPLTTPEEEELQGRLDLLVNEWRQYILTRSIDVKTLGMQAADPRGAFSVIMDLMAAATGIPQRVLLGSEQGELSSAQDERNFGRFLEQRRRRFATPVMVRPTALRLIEAGALPQLSGRLKITWPDLMVLGQKEKAEIADLTARAVQRFSAIGGQQFPTTVVSIEEFRERFLDMSPKAPPPIRLPEGMPAQTQADTGDE